MKKKILLFVLLMTGISLSSHTFAKSTELTTTNSTTNLSQILNRVVVQEDGIAFYNFGTSCGIVGSIHTNVALTDEQFVQIATIFEQVFCGMIESE